MGQNAAVARERDVVVQGMTLEAVQRKLPELMLNSPTAFEGLHIGKDLEVKLGCAKTVAASKVTAPIFNMLMRQREVNGSVFCNYNDLNALKTD
ncbi:MAG: hypothetical protein ACRYFY_22810 [Janthinobacterium lividum]